MSEDEDCEGAPAQEECAVPNRELDSDGRGVDEDEEMGDGEGVSTIYDISGNREAGLMPNDQDNTPLMPGFLSTSPGHEEFFKTTQQMIIARQNDNPSIYKTGPTKYQDGANKGHWTPQEDEQLTCAVGKYNSKNWKKIAECLEGRTDVQCLHRWQKVLNP